MPHHPIPRLRRALIGLCIAVLTMACFPLGRTDSAAQPAGRPAIGLTMSGTELLFTSPEKLNTDLDQVKASGATWLRVDLHTSQFTWTPGQYSWRGMDALVAGANARGIALVGVLSQLPEYARPAGSSRNHGPTTAHERAAFAEFSKTLASRYRGRILAYEVWHNPNMADTWSPSPAISDYVALLADTSVALRAADPNATILAAGTGYSSQPGLASLQWVETLYARGAAAHFDALAVHANPNPNGTLGDLSLLDDYRAVMDRHGDQDARLWVTQSGVATAGEGASTEALQAKLLTAAGQAWARTPNHGPLFWDTLNDRAGASAADHFGLLRRDGSRKPAWDAMTTLTRNGGEGAGATATAPASMPPAAPTTVETGPVAAPAAATSQPPVTIAAASSPRGNRVGFAITGTRLLFQSKAEQEKDLDLVAASGAKWIRVDAAPAQFTWVGPNQYHWDPLDTVVAAAEKRGIKVLAVISQLPVYARPAGSLSSYGPQTEAERAAFARYSSELAKRYKGRIAAYEIWNEANLSHYWSPAPSASNYVKLVVATNKAIKDADPQATVMSAGTGWSWIETDPKPITWIHQLYGNGLKGHVDAFAVHAYSMPWQQNWRGELGQMGDYRKAVDQHDPGRPMWLTETGTTTGGSPSGTEQQAADYISEIINDWERLPNTGPLFFYTLEDHGGADREGHFGFIRTDGTAKPAYRALQQALAS